MKSFQQLEAGVVEQVLDGSRPVVIIGDAATHTSECACVTCREASRRKSLELLDKANARDAGEHSLLVQRGQELLAQDGTVYFAERVNHTPVYRQGPDGRVVRDLRLVKHSMTLRRAIPKVKGKAARKQAKRDRQRYRAQHGEGLELVLPNRDVPVDWPTGEGLEA